VKEILSMHFEKFLQTFLIGIVVTAATAFAQPAAGLEYVSQPPTFDVALVRPMSYGDDAHSHIYNSPRTSEFRAFNVTLRALLEVAYGIPETQMLSGPAWAATGKFDLEAKSDAEFNGQLAALSVEQGMEVKRQMLQALLADRFKLRADAQKREMPIFALVIAKGGPKLITTNVSEAALSGGRGRISIKGGDDALAILAFELSWRLGRPVIDQTGLKGRYELTLNWTEEVEPSPASNASGGPSLFTAIQEQLGLKLEASKGSVPILVIDHAEKPSEN
jgi:uncharacterized protein (TIGR03435 family)